MDEARLAEIEEQHRMYPLDTSSTARLVCAKDMASPCETLELIAEVRRLRAECFDLALKVVERMPNRVVRGPVVLCDTPHG